MPVYSPPHAKRWWSLELTALKKSLNRAQRRLQTLRRDAPLANDPNLLEAWDTFRSVRRGWSKAIKKAKEDHFSRYLGTVNDENVFQASKYATNRAATPRFVPPLKQEDGSFTQTPRSRPTCSRVPSTFQIAMPTWMTLRELNILIPYHRPNILHSLRMRSSEAYLE